MKSLEQHIEDLYNQIKHGDDEHKKWLYDKMKEYLALQPKEAITAEKIAIDIVAAQPKQEAIGDIDLEKLANENNYYIGEHGQKSVLYNIGFITGYKAKEAALLSQQQSNSDAVEFAEWILKEEFEMGIYSFFKKDNISEHEYSPQELYNLFKTTKPDGS